MSNDLKMSFEAIGKELNRVKRAFMSLRNSQISTENELGIANSKISSMKIEIDELKNKTNIPRLVRSGSLVSLNTFSLVLPNTNDCLVLLENLVVSQPDSLKLRAIINEKTLDSYEDYLANGGAPINHYGSMSLMANAKYSMYFKLTNCNDVLNGECHTHDLTEYPSFSLKTDRVWIKNKNKITKINVALDTPSNKVIDGRWAVYSI